VATLQQTGRTRRQVDESGAEVDVHERRFKLIWRQVKQEGPQWPEKRSSHSMNLYKNRFLVLVGGETAVDTPEGP
jgi:hypothetical protein